MYENMTFSYLLQRMLDRVQGNVDKREGSIIYDALAPAAAELSELYAKLDVNIDLAFADTSSGEYLSRRTADFGVNRQAATRAKRLGKFYGSSGAAMDVPIGSRFSAESVNYIVRERLKVGSFVLESETEGAAGNQQFGDMLPIDYISSLARAELVDVLVPGEDEESDTQLRSRFFAEVQNPGTSGNVSDYMRWALSVPGVGGARVMPLWDGPGTVKVVIVNSDKQPASEVLQHAVLDYINENRPIGAEVSIVSASSVPIRIKAKVTLAAGYTIQLVSAAFAKALTAYLDETAFRINYVSIAKLGTLLLAVPGVLDYDRLLLNGGSANIGLEIDEVPIAGLVELEV
ncbi:baseplate J protein [Paenibacillus sp. FSL A5-0031]|uniref:baseplate J/gp47 family protein n=1 Tax=Paenibacillus sp. FSL A5-0031 TaxID=1920420 RepID=UPI00096C2886|nr:baseplate J/gp47 family protein [Paenibacillus sp. FSL A5-0031]OME79064.1 baseplate J protein [Paenibacillus sp. FSL A5-0031]